jgi:hypothetical protein
MRLFVPALQSMDSRHSCHKNNIKARGLMRKWRIKLLAGVVLSSVSALTHASFACGGPITYLGLNSYGTLYVRIASNGVWAICSVTDSFQSSDGLVIKPETCRAWYSALLAGKKAGGIVALYFSSGSSPSQCAQIGSWVVPTPLPYHLDEQ